MPGFTSFRLHHHASREKRLDFVKRWINPLYMESEDGLSYLLTCSCNTLSILLFSVLS